jgi:hypothetical protein
METASRPRLLVFNCHEAWVHQLGVLDCDLDIVYGLPGRYTPTWDTHIRPVPARGRLISLDEARGGGRFSIGPFTSRPLAACRSAS